MNKRSLISLISLSCILLSSPAFADWRSAWNSTTSFVGDLPGCFVEGCKAIGDGAVYCCKGVANIPVKTIGKSIVSGAVRGGKALGGWTKEGGECFVEGCKAIGDGAVYCCKGVANIPVKTIGNSIVNGAVNGGKYVYNAPVKSFTGAVSKVALPATIVGLVCWKLWNRKPEPVVLTNVTHVKGVGSLLTQPTPSN